MVYVVVGFVCLSVCLSVCSPQLLEFRFLIDAYIHTYIHTILALDKLQEHAQCHFLASDVPYFHSSKVPKEGR